MLNWNKNFSISSSYKSKRELWIREDKSKTDKLCHNILLQLANGGVSDLEDGSDDEDNPEAEFESFEEESFQENVKNEDEAVLSDVEMFVEVDPNHDYDSQNNNSECEVLPIKVKQNISKKNEDWEKKEFTKECHEFTGEKPEKEEILSPYQYFIRYLPVELMTVMAEQTNIYYQIQTGCILNATTVEIQKLIGIHMHMGTLKFPRVEMYWAPSSRIDLIASSMTLKRFFRLRNNLHLINTKPTSSNNVFWKVQPIIDSFLCQCKKLKIEKNICVDEQIIPFKGNFRKKVHIKNKPTSWGIKVYLLCGKSGTIYNLLMYQGSTTKMSPEIKTEFGEAAGTVITLTNIIPTGCYYQLFCDNYFTSTKLLRHLESISIYCTGTIRSNRLGKNLPLTSKAKIEKMKRGFSEEIVSNDGKLVVTQWIENRTVLMISNKVGIGEEDKCKRYCRKTKEKVEVFRPQCIQEYNKSMGGVDFMDFLMSLYRCRIRSTKWTLRVIFHFVDLAVCNSWLEYRQQANFAKLPKRKIMDLKAFRDEIAETLMKIGDRQTPKRGRPKSHKTPKPKRRRIHDTRPVTDVRYDQIGHFPQFVATHSSSRCKNENCKGHSRIRCAKCNIHLCISSKNNCFFKFHNK